MNTIIIAFMVATSLLALNNKKFLNSWIFNPSRIESNHEYYRFITSGFIHANYLHLFVNMFTLYFFGSSIESELGGIHLLAILLLGIIISDFPSYTKHRHNPRYLSLGASGGVSAVVFAYIILDPVSKMGLLLIPISIPAFIFGAIFLMYSYYQSQGESGDNVNHSAHFYGAIVGIVYTIIENPLAFFTFFERLINWRIF